MVGDTDAVPPFGVPPHGPTVIVSVPTLTQPAVVVYEIVDEPAEIPTITPVEELILIILGTVAVHAPPEGVAVRVVVTPPVSVPVPEIMPVG